MKFHHLGVACENIKQTLEYMQAIYDVESVSEVVIDSLQDAEVCFVSINGSADIELVSGSQIKSIVQSSFNMYHVCYEVHNLQAQLDLFLQNGAILISSPKPAKLFNGRLVAFIQTPLGLLELLECEKNEFEGPKKELQIVSTFSANMLESPINALNKKLSFFSKNTILQYGHVHQALLDPKSSFYHNSGFNLVLFRFPDLQRFCTSTSERFLAETKNEFVSAIKHLAGSSEAAVVVIVCPHKNKKYNSYNKKFVMEMSYISNVYAFNYTDFNLAVDGNFYDNTTDEIAHLPYSCHGSFLLSVLIFRCIFSIFKKPHKVIAVDCDNTLWSGIAGEMSLNEIKLTKANIFLQKILIKQATNGVLIYIFSKNNESTVWNVFENHGSMILRKKHIAGAYINWGKKSDNLKSLSKKLNLSLDSFVFVDDSPVECADVCANCPFTLVVKLPNNDADALKFLSETWAFDISRSAHNHNDERLKFYKKNDLREKEKNASPSFSAFLSNLELEVNVYISNKSEIHRLVELTYRVNQFNFTGITYSESSLVKLISSGNKVFSVKVQDKYGSYGLVGVILTKAYDESLIVTAFYLSCRALGKGVEYDILRKIAVYAFDSNYKYIVINYRTTSQNLPALAFLNSINFMNKTEDNFVFNVTDLLNLRYEIEVDQRENIENAHSGFNMARATENNIIKLMNNGFSDLKIVDHKSHLLASKDDIIISLKEIFVNVLRVNHVHEDDDFFKLGGSSLNAIVAVSKIIQATGTNISIKQFYESPRPSGIASILAGKFGQNIKKTVRYRYMKNYPISFFQERIFFMCSLYPRSHANNMPLVFSLHGDLDILKLEKSFQMIIKKHGAFRTLFYFTSGKIHQKIKKEVFFNLSYYDMSSSTKTDIDKLIINESEYIFDLGAPPLLRVSLIKQMHHKFLLIINIHHIIFDGWSYGVLAKDLQSFYDGKVALGFKDHSFDLLSYASCQREEYKQHEQKYLVFWKDYLNNSVLTKFNTEDIKQNGRDFTGKYLPFILSVDLVHALKAFSQKQKCSLFVVLSSAFVIYLSHYLKVSNITIASIVSTREVEQYGDSIGAFLSTVLLSFDIHNEKSFAQFATEARDRLLKVIGNQNVPLEKILQLLPNIDREEPIDIAMVYHNMEDISLSLNGITSRVYKKRYDVARFKFILEVEEIYDVIQTGIYYRKNLFTDAFINEFSQKYCKMLMHLLEEQQVPLGELLGYSESEGMVYPQNDLLELPDCGSIYYLNRAEACFLHHEIFFLREYLFAGFKISDGDVIVDVGANIGLFSLWVNKQASNLKIFCFEPIPSIYEVLKRNLKKFSVNATALCFALGSRKDEAVLFDYFPRATLLSGIPNIVPDRQKLVTQYLSTSLIENIEHSEMLLNQLTDEMLVSEKTMCTLTTLSDFVSSINLNKIDLLKIDVEGSELDVIAGISRDDWLIIRQVVIEVHDDNNRVDLIKNILFANGFTKVIASESCSVPESNLYIISAIRT